MLAMGFCATCNGMRAALTLASPEARSELGVSVAPGDLFRIIGAQAASAGVGGLAKWMIYSSIANKLNYWGMPSVELDDTFNGGYVFGDFGPLPSDSTSFPDHIQHQAARIGGNASRTMFLAFLLLTSGATVGGLTRTALPVAGVVALGMTIATSVTTLFNHAQRVEIWTGFPSTVLVPAVPAPGLDYGNLTLSGTPNPGLQPTESVNLIIADWVFIFQMLIASIATAGPLAYGLTKGALCRPCSRPASTRGFALAWVAGKAAAGACITAACCSIIAAPMLAVASDALRDKWPEGDAYLSFPSSQFDPDASHAAYDGALLALILLMTVLPVGVVCCGAAAHMLASQEDVQGLLESSFIGRYAQQMQ